MDKVAKKANIEFEAWSVVMTQEISTQNTNLIFIKIFSSSKQRSSGLFLSLGSEMSEWVKGRCLRSDARLGRY